jgi:hypothetical protein
LGRITQNWASNDALYNLTRRTISMLYALGFLVLCTSCDAMLTMTYSVKNKTKNEIQLFVPNLPINNSNLYFGEKKDSFLILLPNQEIIVGSNFKIDFPWARKNIYRKHPGICGIQRIDQQNTVKLGCSKKEWKYWKGVSTLRIK